MILIGLLMLVPLVVGGQTTTMSFTYTWTAPTTGNAVHHYEVVSSNDNGSTWTLKASPTTNSATITLAVGQTWLVRVRAVDALGQTGPWSANADPNTPNAGPPGACGKPGWL